MRMGNFEREKGWPSVKYRNSLPWVVQKRLNRSRCRLGCGLRWPVGPTEHVRWGCTWCRLANMIENLKRPCAAAMQPFCEITLTTCY